MEQTTILENLLEQRHKAEMSLDRFEITIAEASREMAILSAHRDGLNIAIRLLEAQAAATAPVAAPPKPRAPRLNIRAACLAHLSKSQAHASAEDLGVIFDRDPSQITRSLAPLALKGEVIFENGVYRIGKANLEEAAQ